MEKSASYSFARRTAAVAALFLLAGCAAPATQSTQPRREGGSLFPGRTPPPSAAGLHRSFPGFTAVLPREGDTFASLAGEHLGDPSRGWVIARSNGLASPEPGQLLIIPAGPFDRGGLSATGYQTVPVLSYHKFSESRADAMTVTREAFEAQMKFLQEGGFQVVTLDDLYDFLDFKADLPEKAVVLTFDDGWRSMYEIAFPVLKAYDYPATLFVSTEMITGSRKTLSWDQIREMMKGGIDVQNHTVTHRNLEEMTEGETLEEYVRDLERELVQSTETIRDRTGREVRYLAYPYGATGNLVIAMVRKLGYRGALTVKRGASPFFIQNFRVNRSMIYGDFDLARFEKNLATTGRRALQ